MRRKLILGILVILTLALTACGSARPTKVPVTESPTTPAKVSGTTPTESPADAKAPEATAGASDTTPTRDVEPPAPSGSTASTLDEDYPDASPVFMQLVLGTMLLEETPNGVTAEQAQELLPLWQMFRAIRRGDAPPSLEEIEAITDQIMAAMTPEQLGTIKGMQITQDDVRAFVQENDIPQSGPGGSGGGGGGMGSGSDTADLSPEERRIRMITTGGKNLVDELLRRLEMWGG